MTQARCLPATSVSALSNITTSLSRNSVPGRHTGGVVFHTTATYTSQTQFRQLSKTLARQFSKTEEYRDSSSTSNAEERGLFLPETLVSNAYYHTNTNTSCHSASYLVCSILTRMTMTNAIRRKTRTMELMIDSQ